MRWPSELKGNQRIGPCSTLLGSPEPIGEGDLVFSIDEGNQNRRNKKESNENLVRFRIDSQELNSEYLIDASGYESYIRSGGKTIQGAQYLVYGSWFNKSTVEVYIDPVVSPSFFTWVIPISHDLAKIGIGGEGINTFKALDKFAESKKAAIIRKMAAP